MMGQNGGNGINILKYQKNYYKHTQNQLVMKHVKWHFIVLWIIATILILTQQH